MDTQTLAKQLHAMLGPKISDAAKAVEGVQALAEQVKDNTEHAARMLEVLGIKPEGPDWRRVASAAGSVLEGSMDLLVQIKYLQLVLAEEVK